MAGGSCYGATAGTSCTGGGGFLGLRNRGGTSCTGGGGFLGLRNRGGGCHGDAVVAGSCHGSGWGCTGGCHGGYVAAPVANCGGCAPAPSCGCCGTTAASIPVMGTPIGCPPATVIMGAPAAGAADMPKPMTDAKPMAETKPADPKKQ
jgi:hypothetical protein